MAGTLPPRPQPLTSSPSLFRMLFSGAEVILDQAG
eukprot:CAMPEP_0172569584 /NCGR_PEP_ID=MMETSP1067-20121228/124114_1 /TAXON_ID=265564 ORGANISM="Thalassiosira punctigera, Strain Tpunct2005C2" /NCGR_SAMPLE_ID=MMETSP1067 /ASSEMBLY_ACC=CAM_ASM_000444 /LENGTH=34 /DNA_ID= /DNA_START= /DNA_END= /DNA_ORIENTATION=